MKSPTESNVPNYPRGISRRNLIKRGLIAGIALSPASRLFAASDDQKGSNAQLSNLAYSVDTLSSPSQAQQVKGGQAFAQTVGLDLNTLLSSGNTEREIADVNAVLSKFNGKVALMIDPLDSPDARPVVEACAKAGAYVVTIWNKTEDLHPWDFDGHYVAHISFDGIDSGKSTAESMFAALGGSGGIVGLGGIANNVPAIDRKAGLQQAIDASGGKIKLLDFQVGDWASAKAFSITQAWLTRFGDDIKGIWAANDEMALGAIQALAAEGLNGKIKVCATDGTPPGIDAVEKGDLVCTSDWNPYLWGALGLSLAHKAATGQYDPTKEPKAHREFYGKSSLVDASNVKAVKAVKAGSPPIEYDKLWDNVLGQIRS